MSSLGHMTTWYPMVRDSISTGGSSIPRAIFFLIVYNSLLQIAWLCSRNLGLCIIIFLLEVAINSTLHLSPPQMLPKPYGLSGQVAQAAGKLSCSLDLCRAFFCSRLTHCWKLWSYDAHSVSHLEKREPNLYTSLTTGQTKNKNKKTGQRCSL